MQFQDERLVAVVSVNASCERIWQETKRWCEDRTVFKKPLTKHQVTQFKFVEMAVQIEAARAMADVCVRKRVQGEDATREITMAKVFTGRMCRYVSDQCIQLQGGFGYMKESVAGRGFVDMRLISIGGGADEVMIQYLAKMLGF
jgi:citronellyl-CoA dehydrogenase